MLGCIFIDGYNIRAFNSSVLLCKIFFYASVLFPTLLPTVLICASIDRLLISSQNVDTRLYSSRRLAYFSLGVSTVFWVIFHFHVLIKVTLQSLGPSVVICLYDLTKSYVQFVSYSSLIKTSFFSLLLIILIILAFKNVRQIKIIPREKRNQIRSMTKKDLQLLRCLFAQDIVYIAFSIFLNVYHTYASARLGETQTALEQAVTDFLRKFLTFLQFVPFCVNFVVFIVVSKAFRNEVKRMVYKMIGKPIVLIQEEENRQGVGKGDVTLDVVSTIELPP